MYTYDEAVAYIEEIPKFTAKNKLEHTKECLRRLGNPTGNANVIHVAGTNGKGSVCAFLSSMLEQGGYRVGLFTSPHLVTINERFQINEVPVDDEEFIEAFSKVKNLSDELLAQGSYHPTYFEFLFLMGMLVFSKNKVDYIVLETGLGGRLDATNSIETPIACVITSISLDHVEYLGNTVADIAREKAGIIKSGAPVIYDGNDEVSAEIIRNKAKEMHTFAYPVTEEQNEILQITEEGIDFSFKCEYYDTTTISIPFIAKYQMQNAALALKSMEVLRRVHGLSRDRLINGVAKTKWQGRMETIMPGVIVDGAHNEDGVTRFIETALHFQEKFKITLLFSAVADKDYADMIAVICRHLSMEAVVTTQIWGSRIVSAKELADEFRKNGCCKVYEMPDVGAAFDRAVSLKRDGLLFCVGSLYLIGEIKDYLRRKAND